MLKDASIYPDITAAEIVEDLEAALQELIRLFPTRSVAAATSTVHLAHSHGSISPRRAQ